MTDTRVLLISYYFPPIGGPHSLRWTYLVTSLVQAGFQVEVLTVQPAQGYTSLDESLLRLLPAEVDIHRVSPGPLHGLRYNSLATPYLQHGPVSSTRSWRQAVLQGLKRNGLRLAEAMLVPDLMVEWLPAALQRAKGVLRQRAFDVIISSAYPVCDHLLGYRLKRQTGLPLICHYSDPWLFYTDRQVGWLRYRLEQYLETRLLHAAAHLLVPTAEAKAGFLQAFPFLVPDDISLVPAGADMGQYATIAPLARDRKRFRLVYTGTFYDRLREPAALYTALHAVAGDIGRDIEVICAGNIQAHHRDMTLGSCVQYWDYQARDACIALQKSADVLLFVGNTGMAQLPSKLFEYFAAARPILSIEPAAHTPAAQLIARHRRGISVANEPEAIAAAIRHLYDIWKMDQLDQAFCVYTPLPAFSWEASGRACAQAVQSTLATLATSIRPERK